MHAQTLGSGACSYHGAHQHLLPYEQHPGHLPAASGHETCREEERQAPVWNGRQTATLGPSLPSTTLYSQGLTIGPSSQLKGLNGP